MEQSGDGCLSHHGSPGASPVRVRSPDSRVVGAQDRVGPGIFSQKVCISTQLLPLLLCGCPRVSPEIFLPRLEELKMARALSSRAWTQFPLGALTRSPLQKPTDHLPRGSGSTPVSTRAEVPAPFPDRTGVLWVRTCLHYGELQRQVPPSLEKSKGQQKREKRS